MSFFHNLTTNIKVINLKHLKSLIDIAHYGNDDHALYVLAVALPMFVLTRLSKRVFFQLHSKCKVGSFRRIYCSFPVSVNSCFASEPYSLLMVSLEILQSG